MKEQRMRHCFYIVVLGLAQLTFPLQAQVQITEFMANNTRTLKDDFGQYEDWIELFNYSANNVNLLDWGLTDNADHLFAWRFPSTNLPPGAFLVVFASNRDRRIPGRQLHANFKLGASGDYLALTRPDGAIATQFAPAYPPQFPDVSYGFAPNTAGDLLVTGSSAGRVMVPANDALGTDWTALAFNDTAWLAATNGFGFETGQSDDPSSVSAAVLADQPAAYWRFNGTNDTVAANDGWLGSAAQGQLLNGAIPGVPGPRPSDFSGFESNNLALRLDGAGARLEAPYAPELNPSGPFTIEAWVKPARAGFSTPAWVLSSLNVSSGARNGYALAQDYSARNQWEFRLGDSSGYIALAYGGVVDTNHWQYLAGVYDGGSARLFVNGALAASATLSRPFAPNTTQKLLLGGRIDAANPYYYAGDVDEVALMARALSATEIATRYQRATNRVSPDGLFNYTALIHTDLRQDMWGVNSSVYLRLPFTLTNLVDLNRLTLRVKYDDGFAAYLNGVPVASANAPASLVWNSVATNRHATEQALQFEEFDLSAYMGSLRNGSNILAVQGLNLSATNTDFLLLTELEAVGSGMSQAQIRYFVQPTPRATNGVGAKDLGPIITSADNSPITPGANDSLTVTCRITPAFAPVTNVTLNWRVMFNPLNQTPMFDDGGHGDGAANDGVYGAVIPNQTGAVPTYTAGQMVRWYITATDSLSRTSRWPIFANPTASAEYLGTVVQPDYVASKLPIFHLFAPPTVLQPGPTTSQIGADSESGGRVSLFYDGEFYDNIYMELRGNTSAGLNKKAHRLEFNPEHPFRHPGPGGRLRKSSLLAEHLDPAYLRQHLCFWFLDLIGVPSPFDYPVRAQLNGAFYQLAFHNDVLGAEQLERLGYDPAGTLYKCVGTATPNHSSTGGFQKLLPRTNLTSTVDYDALAYGINEARPIATRRATVFDLLDVPQVINYLAGARFCSENDDVWANMSLFRDTYGDGLYRIVPFDMNASWGQLYGGSSPLQATNDNAKSHPFYGGSQVQENGSSAWNRMYDVIIALPETRDMLRRRERTLLDNWVFPPGTAPENLIIENHIKQMTNMVWAEAMLDRQKWGYSSWAPGKTFPSGINDLLTQFVGPRRKHWYVTHCVTNTARPLGLGNSYNAGLPISQPANAVVSIVSWDCKPVSGNQDEEYLCLTNVNNYAVDISGWRLSGGVSHQFRPGTIIPTNSVLYVSPNVAAFRARTVAPRGGMSLLVQGNYSGHLNAWGEDLMITDPAARLVSSNHFEGTPSLAQQYLRITEIMYNPAPLPGNTNDPQNFEYLELKNVSTDVTLDLTGVRLTNGIDFRFTGSLAASLPPGQTVLLVRNTNAFALRYGFRINMAGQYNGSLDNAGETLRLEDASGEKILEFAYDNKWYPITDGLGFSLVVVNEQALWSAWGQKDNWRPSGALNGSPGESDPLPSDVPPIRVNELLAHPDQASVDAVEFYNPTRNGIDIGGWLLTDDFYYPAKYRIPPDTIIPSGGFLVFTSDQFGTGTNAFQFSKHGDQVYLFGTDAAANLNGYYHGFAFGASPNGVSFGRYVTSQGEEHFVLQSAPTLGTINAPPRVGPVVISEFMYRPPDLTNQVDNDLDEFIELQNITSTNVPLYCAFTNEVGYGLAALTNTWRLRNAVEYDFPTNTILYAGSRLLVVGFDPTNLIQLASFRERYAVPSETPVFGPWKGRLGNIHETIELLSPYRPDPLALDAIVPYLLIDQVAYQHATPWPTNADGLGDSLQRINLAAYGNDPVNWLAGAPTPGLLNATPLAIVSITLSGDQVGVSAATARGLNYVLEYKNDLTDADWTPLSPSVPGTGDILVLTDMNTLGTIRFYRIRAQ